MTAGVALATLPGLSRLALADGLGPVNPPLAIPPLPATLSDGRRLDLRRLLPGKVTAIQFMLTTCSSVCPLLGAMFASVQSQLRDARVDNVQLLSVSVDVLGDSPSQLAAWLKRFGAGANWHAALPDASSSTAIDTLRKLGAGVAERDQHEAGILLIDRRGRLVYRLDELPDPGLLTRRIIHIATM